MKKYLSLMLIAAVFATFSACKKDDDPGDNPPPVDKEYNVEYKFEVNENHGNVKLIYYGPSLDKHEIENPASPWQVSYADFKQSDSVYFHFEIIPLANTQLIYSWEVSITGDGYTNGNNGSGNTQYLDSIPPNVSGGWAFKIE